MFPTVGGVTVGMGSTEMLIVHRKKAAHKIMKEQGKAHGRPRQGFRINARGFFEPDLTGRLVLTLIRDKPMVKASKIRQETDLNYYDA